MRRVLLGTVLATALSLSFTAPALGAERTVRDEARDVLQGRVTDMGGYVYTPVAEGDVLRTTFRHGPRNVVVTSRFRALTRVGIYHAYYTRLQTGSKLYREVTVETRPGAWAGRATVTRRDGSRVRCAVGHRIDYSRSTVRVTVPRSCLKNPRIVRATAANIWAQEDEVEPTQPAYVYLDNPHNDSHLANTWTAWIRRG